MNCSQWYLMKKEDREKIERKNKTGRKEKREERRKWEIEIKEREKERRREREKREGKREWKKRKCREGGEKTYLGNQIWRNL